MRLLCIVIDVDTIIFCSGTALDPLARERLVMLSAPTRRAVRSHACSSSITMQGLAQQHFSKRFYRSPHTAANQAP